MARLGTKERDAVVLHFFEKCTVREVAAALGLQEAAAQKRVNRATDKLRSYFSRKGVQISAVALVTLIGSQAVQAAPAGLATKIAAAAAVKVTAGGFAAGPLYNCVFKIIAWAKANLAIVGTSTVIVAAGTAVVFDRFDREESIDAKIVWLSKPGTPVGQVIHVLGEPMKYAAGTNTLDKAHLPDGYWMVYSNAVNVLISHGKVKQLGSLRPGPGFSVRGKLRLGSTLAEVLDEVGPPLQTLTAQPGKDILGVSLGGYAGVLYRDLDGTKGKDYYWRPDQNLRFLFREDKVTALLIDVPN